MHRVFAYSLVAAQFTLAALLVVTTRLAPLCFGCLTIAGAGGALAVWAWLVMGLRRLNFLPHVRGDAELITAMPYRFVRHPMYTGLLVLCGGLIFTNYSHWKTVAWVLLAITLDLKARLEERLLVERFSAYEEYCRRTWRFVPFLY
jgi:protein-S-isoprenylcysteine O-methyltransferase Ste14